MPVRALYSGRVVGEVERVDRVVRGVGSRLGFGGVEGHGAFGVLLPAFFAEGGGCGEGEGSGGGGFGAVGTARWREEGGRRVEGSRKGLGEWGDECGGQFCRHCGVGSCG